MRKLAGTQRIIGECLLAAIPIVAILGVLNVPYYLGISLYREQFVSIIAALMLAASFVFCPAKVTKLVADKVPIYDLFFAFCSVVIGLYVAINYDQILMDIGILKPERVILGTLCIFLFLEAARRQLGKTFVIIALVAMGYALLANYCPAILKAKSVPFPNLITYLYLDSHGVFGIPIQIGTTLVLVFIFFGVVLNAVGVDVLFNNIALSIMGKYRGGPAKASVIASGLFGMISGSAVANVVTTGSFTIPLMKRMGFNPAFAGAVEAVASTGGLIMPPVMGAAAFLMATYIGVPYREIAICAFIPAILYYLSVLVQVDSRAAKSGLKGLEPHEIPKMLDIIKKNWPFLVPFLVLVVTLFFLWMETETSGLLSTLAAIMVGLLMKKQNLTLRTFYESLKRTGMLAIEIGVTCGVAGIVIGTLTISGLGLSFSGFLVELAHGKIFLLLLFAGLGTAILGMGMTVTACYLLMVAVVAPALESMGISPFLAHFFVFYYGVLSFITPPVCLACYAAASIAGAKVFETALNAMKLGVVAYMVPFIFVYKPALLLQGSWTEVLQAIAFAVVGVYTMARGLEGYFFSPLRIPTKLLLITSGVCSIVPGYQLNIIGLGIFLVITLRAWKKSKQRVKRT